MVQPAIETYTLTNSQGCEARITNYGGIILSLKVPDRAGTLGDVVLGFDRAEDYRSTSYLERCPYFGALIGRYANRIANGTFRLAGQEYHVPVNNGTNGLHGGTFGFDKRIWEGETHSTARGPALALRYVSADGEEGYPGMLQVSAVYTLTEENELRVDFRATTDRETVVSLTQHSYFNLKGDGGSDILDHELMIRAAEYVPIDAGSIPLGPTLPVAGTPFDFNLPTMIGARIDSEDQQIRNGSGYDHNWVIDGYVLDSEVPVFATRVVEHKTGRVLEVGSTQPGVQFYSGNVLDGTFTGKAGVRYERRTGFCLEPQHFPDSPNQQSYPTTVLRPGETYRHTIVYRFSVV